MFEVVFRVAATSEIRPKTDEAYGSYLEHIDRENQFFGQFDDLRCHGSSLSKSHKKPHIQLS